MALAVTGCTSREAPPESTNHDQAPAEPTEPAPTVPPGTPSVPVEVVQVPAPPGAELAWVRANACEDAAPMSLTASDGTGLRLASLTARAVVEGPLAFTELRLSFDNPEDRQLEGRFSITLPPGSAISRFAMQIDGRWQEGEVVERQAARVAYEDFLHRRQDPALLENDAGNVFRARVFPIPPRARKELVLSYSQELVHEAEPYRLPLCGLPQLDLLDVDVAIVQGTVGGDSSLGGVGTSVYHLGLQREKLAPTKDLEARVGHVPAEGLRYGDLAVARVVPVLDNPAESITALTILMDTSASRALDFRGQVERLGALVASLPGEARVHVVAYDQRTELVYSGRADGLSTAMLEGLRERGAMGASDLSQALAALPGLGAASPRLVLVGDGVVTAGAHEASELQLALRGLMSHGLRRVDAIVDGGIQDQAMLAALTRAELPQDGVVLDARMPASTLAERLGQATRSGLRVTVPGAEWVWPTTFDGVQPGDARLVYVQLPPELPLEIQLDGAAVRDRQPVLASVPEALLGRAHAQARIAALQAERGALAADEHERRRALQDEIVGLSTRHRVLSDFTALLVLETEADYARFGIDRRALADILTVGPSGVERLRRVEPIVAEPMPIEEPEVPEEIVAVEKKAEVAAADVDGKDDDKGFGGPADPSSLLPSAPAPGGPLAEGRGGEDDGDAFGVGGLGLRGTGSGGGGVGEPSQAAPPPEPSAAPADEERPARARRARPMTELADGGAVASKEKPPVADPYQGRFAIVMAALARGDLDGAEREAVAWRGESPGDVLALVAVGEVHEARGRRDDAARAYGSLIDLFPSRADLRRMAGERLERLGGNALALAIDTYAHAVEQRPDHPSSHRLHAYALLKAGRHAEAFAAIEASLDRSYPGGRFAGVEQVLREDLGLIGAAWIAADPSQRAKVEASLTKHGATLATTASTRFVLNWETDANDVDLHVYDAKGGHAYFSNRTLGSGGQLYADVTTGYGPECFALEGKRRAGPYQVLAHYYARGPMGYGMGKLEIIEHDGAGHLRFGEHPFVIMKDDGYVELATVGATIVEPPPPSGARSALEDEPRPGMKVIYQAE
ncbi:VIT domain-containing protein [Paraliomyxa miuraensis]|uniref:VIT domain-containing protein n=1 Tax=Paraliomyxa miuraensis TaxID=376150 RepID=UPI00225167FF|nr:VIT domain-containing protein [Paraliomyxa miuraensis]